MAEYVCDRCGEVNPVGTVFCVNCHAFLAWDEVERDERLAGETAAGCCECAIETLPNAP
jgi:hypothetical protein